MSNITNYENIMNIMARIANELNVTMFKPEYHGKNNDRNTVLFYTNEDEEHNKKVDAQDVQYSQAEADFMAKTQNYHVDDRFVYRNHFWSYETSDVNNMLDYNFANHGEIDFRGKDIYETLKTVIAEALRKNQLIKNSYTLKVMTIDGKTVEIMLDSKQIESIYRHQEHNYLIQDAENHLREYVAQKINEDKDSKNFEKKANKFCKTVLHMNFTEMCNPNNKNYILNQLVNEFKQRQDCNIPENTTWDYVVEQFFLSTL